MRFSKLA